MPPTRHSCGGSITIQKNPLSALIQRGPEVGVLRIKSDFHYSGVNSRSRPFLQSRKKYLSGYEMYSIETLKVGIVPFPQTAPFACNDSIVAPSLELSSIRQHKTKALSPCQSIQNFLNISAEPFFLNHAISDIQRLIKTLFFKKKGRELPGKIILSLPGGVSGDRTYRQTHRRNRCVQYLSLDHRLPRSKMS